MGITEVALKIETLNKVVQALMLDPRVAAFDALNTDFMVAQQKEAVRLEEEKKKLEAEAKTKAAETGKSKK